jgi:hypothetical protein
MTLRGRWGLALLTVVESAFGAFMLRVAFDAWVHGGIAAGIVATFLALVVVSVVGAVIWDAWRNV